MSVTQREVAVQRVGLVDAHAAVQVVAGAAAPPGASVAEPVRRDREVVARRRAPASSRQAAFVGRQVERPRGDVDVGDLHRDRLELRQRAAELGAVLDVAAVRSRAPATSPARGEAEAGDGVLAQHPRGAVAGSSSARGAVEDDRVRR